MNPNLIQLSYPTLCLKSKPTIYTLSLKSSVPHMSCQGDTEYKQMVLYEACTELIVACANACEHD